MGEICISSEMTVFSNYLSMQNNVHKRYLAPIAGMLLVSTGVIAVGLQTPARAINIGPTTFTTLDSVSINLDPGIDYTSWTINNNTGIAWTDFHFAFSGPFTTTTIPGGVSTDIDVPVIDIYGLDIENGQSFDPFNSFANIAGPFKITVAAVTTVKGTPSVPGPLPLLGVAAAFGYSRKLRKRIKGSESLQLAGGID